MNDKATDAKLDEPGKIEIRIDHPKRVFTALRDLMDDTWNEFLEWHGELKGIKTIEYQYCSGPHAESPSTGYREANADDWSNDFYGRTPCDRIELILEYLDSQEGS